MKEAFGDIEYNRLKEFRQRKKQEISRVTRVTGDQQWYEADKGSKKKRAIRGERRHEMREV